MDIIVKGIITDVLPMESGVGKQSGKAWTKQSYLLEHEHGQYARSLCFDVFGEERIGQMNILKGEELTVHLAIECREYQGRYYNSIGAWKVEREQQAAVQNGVVYAEQPVQQAAPFAPAQGQAAVADDLPF